MIEQKLEEDIQSKINKILTDFVIEYRKDDNEERIDSLHNQTVEKFWFLFETILDEITKEMLKKWMEQS